jgi:hypothetical protein
VSLFTFRLLIPLWVLTAGMKVYPWRAKFVRRKICPTKILDRGQFPQFYRILKNKLNRDSRSGAKSMTRFRVSLLDWEEQSRILGSGTALNRNRRYLFFFLFHIGNGTSTLFLRSILPNMTARDAYSPKMFLCSSAASGLPFGLNPSPATLLATLTAA